MHAKDLTVAEAMANVGFDDEPESMSEVSPYSVRVHLARVPIACHAKSRQTGMKSQYERRLRRSLR
jgi:hypothetical protein